MTQGRALRLLGWLLCGALAAPVARARPAPDESAIKEAERAEPPDPYISAQSLFHFLRAALARDAGDSATAIAQLKLATIYDATHAYPQYMLAQEHFLLGHLPQAEQAVRAALSIEADHAPSLLLLGRITFARGRLDEALDAFTRASAANPLDPDAYAWLVDTYLTRNDVQAAIALGGRIDALVATSHDLNVVRRLQATAAAASARVAEIFVAQGQLDKAEELYRRAAAEEPNRASHLITLARFYEKQSRFRESADALMKALALGRDDQQLAVDAAGLYLRVGDRRAALGCAEVLSVQATGSDAFLHRSAEAMLSIGDALVAEQAFEQARRAYALAGATEPGWNEPIFREGDALEHLGRFAEAAAKFRRIPGGDPLFVSAQPRAALCDYTRGAHSQATTALRSLEKAFPNTPDVVVALARTMESDGNLKGAAKLLESVPTGKVTPPVARTLFRIAPKVGHDAEALRVLQVAVARFPRDPDLSFDLVQALDESGNRQQAIYEARRLTERAPTMGVVLDFLARALAEAGGSSLDEAEEYARRAILAWPDRGRYVATLAIVQEAKGNAEALYTWRRAADMLPGDSETQLRLAEAEAKASHAGEARAAFNRALALAEASREKTLASRARQGLAELQTVARSPAP